MIYLVALAVLGMVIAWVVYLLERRKLQADVVLWKAEASAAEERAESLREALAYEKQRNTEAVRSLNFIVGLIPEEETDEDASLEDSKANA